jgi:hypothetical protein
VADAVPPGFEPCPTLGQRRNGLAGFWHDEQSLIANNEPKCFVIYPGRLKISCAVWVCKVRKCVEVSFEPVILGNDVGVAVDRRNSSELGEKYRRRTTHAT